MCRTERGALKVCWRREAIERIFAGVAMEMWARFRGISVLVTEYELAPN